MTTPPDSKTPSPGLQVASLAVGLGIMIVGTLYPPMMTRSTGGADHLMATLLFWSMSAGFIRGLGFVPRNTALRWIFSGWACGAALVSAIGWRLAT